MIESILKELSELPPAKLVTVAGYVHQLTEAGQKDRQDWLRRSYGSMSDDDARAFEEALASSRPVAYPWLTASMGS